MSPVGSRTAVCMLCILVGCGHSSASRQQATTHAAKESPAVTNETRAREFVDLLVAKRFSDASGSFDGAMKAALPADKLEQVWATLVSQAGPFQTITGSRARNRDAYEIVYVSCKFEKVALDAKIVFDRAHLISGLFFVPAEEPAADASTPPPYARRESFEEQDISIGTGEWKLPGTLTMPRGPGPFPALVLVHGSGPNDRDETLGPNKPFRDLAWGLASRGIAVIRYDKRTKVYGAKLAGVRDFTVQQEVIDDAVAAAAAARSTARIDPRRVFVLGHSLGGNLAPRILAGDAAIAGAVVLAGSTRPMARAILEQVTYIAELDGEISKEEATNIEALKTELARMEEPSFSAASEAVLGVPASYWLDLRGYDPVATAKALTRPLLILQGGRDYQVTRADFEGWERGLKGLKNVELQLYPELNHQFIAGTGKSSPDEYSKAGNVAVEVVDDVARWILSSPPRK